MARSKPNTGKVRIIGGRWRGTQLPVVQAKGLRPSADRSRETLFNWLQAELAGARCLDLFAGSGALGLEALSRGASHCTLVEDNPQVAAVLQESVSRLRANTARLVVADALQWLEHGPAQPFDLIFLDPPFACGLAKASCAALLSFGWLNRETLVYLEQGLNEEPAHPPQWEVLREGRSRDACYRLLRARQ